MYLIPCVGATQGFESNSNANSILHCWRNVFHQLSYICYICITRNVWFMHMIFNKPLSWAAIDSSLWCVENHVEELKFYCDPNTIGDSCWKTSCMRWIQDFPSKFPMSTTFSNPCNTWGCSARCLFVNQNFCVVFFHALFIIEKNSLKARCRTLRTRALLHIESRSIYPGANDPTVINLL